MARRLRLHDRWRARCWLGLLRGAELGTIVGMGGIAVVLLLLGIVVAADRRAARGFAPPGSVFASDRLGAVGNDSGVRVGVDARRPARLACRGRGGRPPAVEEMVLGGLAPLPRSPSWSRMLARSSRSEPAVPGLEWMERYSIPLRSRACGGGGRSGALGDAARGWLDRGASAYRALERPLWVVRGEPAEARVILRQAGRPPGSPCWRSSRWRLRATPRRARDQARLRRMALPSRRRRRLPRRCADARARGVGGARRSPTGHRSPACAGALETLKLDLLAELRRHRRVLH